MGEKEECLTYTTGAVEVRQTAHEMTIINQGTDPITVHLSGPCTVHQDSDMKALELAKAAIAGVIGTIALYFVLILLLALRG
ncbi:MAG: hypothetical protein IKO07_06335 [Clostridia bacterium]|nr:hypothetical protein [Clostridia bacterium]